MLDASLVCRTSSTIAKSSQRNYVSKRKQAKTLNQTARTLWNDHYGLGVKPST